MTTDMKIRDIMTKDVMTVAPDTPLKEVIERMVRSAVSGVPVVDSSGRLVGIVTEADVITKEAYGGGRPRALALLVDTLAGRDHHWVAKATGLTAADVMSEHPVVCEPTDDVVTVARRMLERGVKRMPVAEDGRLEGIVSRKDILAVFDRPDEAIAGEIAEVLATHPNRPDDCHVSSTIKDGIVTLSGDVRYEWDEPMVIAIVRSVPGVLDVVSHLHHRESTPSSSPSPWEATALWPTERQGRN